MLLSGLVPFSLLQQIYAGGNPAMNWHPIHGGQGGWGGGEEVEILLFATETRDEPLGNLYPDFTYLNLF